jgi:hypothetical protein
MRRRPRGPLANVMGVLSATDDNRLRSPLADALHADGPNPVGEAELMQFGRFVGSWDLDVVYYDEEGKVRRRTPGEWHFGWVLEGRAIQDVWIVPPRRDRPRVGPPPGEYGMTLRFYDAAIGAWRSTWHGPVNGIVWPFIARATGDEMVLERRADGMIERWIFGSIEPDAFHWRSVKSTDEGVSWHLQQEMFATRSASPGLEPRTIAPPA